MNGPENEIKLIVLWTAVLVMNLLFIIPILMWAIRSGQFRNMDHSRYLALDEKNR